MGKRSRKINRAHGRHKLPGESRKEFARRTNNGERIPDDLVLVGRVASVPAPPINSPFTEPSPVLTDEQIAAAEDGPDIDLHLRGVPELRALAKEQGLKGYSKMNKAELLNLLG